MQHGGARCSTMKPNCILQVLQNNITFIKLVVNIQLFLLNSIKHLNIRLLHQLHRVEMNLNVGIGTFIAKHAIENQ